MDINDDRVDHVVVKLLGLDRTPLHFVVHHEDILIINVFSIFPSLSNHATRTNSTTLRSSLNPFIEPVIHPTRGPGCFLH